MALSKRFKYHVLYNCNYVVDEKGAPLEITGGKAERSFGSKVPYDSRLNAISVMTEMDYTTYVNYYKTFIYLLNSHSSNMNIKSLYTSHLDMGLVPIYVPPTFMNAANTPILKTLKEAIMSYEKDGEKLRYIELEPIRFDNTLASSIKTDIWISRMQMAKFLGVTPDMLVMDVVLEEILKRYWS